jgi:predicted dehydrogenase
MSNPLQIAVVGSGIGVEHIKGFQELPELFDVQVLCDVNRERAAPVAEKYRIRKLVGSLDEVSSLPDIDVIDICTPPASHLAQIESALKAGKHVICEKPLVGSLAAVDSIARLADQSGRQIMPIFQYRFGRGLQKLKYLIERNLAGQAFVFNVDVAWWRDSEYYRNPWRGKAGYRAGRCVIKSSHPCCRHGALHSGPREERFWPGEYPRKSDRG